MKFLVTLSALTLTAIIAVTGCNQTASSQQTVSNQQAANKNSSVSDASNQTPKVQKTSSHNDEAKRISLADAKAAFDAGKAVFVDTRDADSFKSGHIKGALNMQAQEVQARVKELPTDKQIIAYCSWPSEHTSARAVQIMNENGVTNAAALVGGTKAWQDAGHPMEKNDKK